MGESMLHSKKAEIAHKHPEDAFPGPDPTAQRTKAIAECTVPGGQGDPLHSCAPCAAALELMARDGHSPATWDMVLCVPMAEGPAGPMLCLNTDST